MRALIFLFLFFPSELWAWSAPAHRVVAQIAYDQLTPATKKTVDKLNKDFVASATWLDQIKREDVTAFNRWHFIALPRPQSDNVVWAVEQSQKALHGKGGLKTFFLPVLVHLVADAHQPLHCMNRVTAKYPKGDRGGNFFLIKNAHAKNLHQAWDGGLGLFDSYYTTKSSKRRLIKRWAHDLTSRYPTARYQLLIEKQQPMIWASESFRIAKTFAYNTPEGGALSPDYLKQGQKISEERLALAGYRLAAMLNAIFKE